MFLLSIRDRTGKPKGLISVFHVDYRYLRPRKADALQKLHAKPYPKCESPAVWKGANATILPLRTADNFDWTGKGGVVDETGQYVDLSATYSFVNGAYPFESPEYRNERVVYCGYLVSHWGHFLVDAVNRLWYFLENDPAVDKYVFILKENEQREVRGNYQEFFKLLKIWDKLEFISSPTTFREVVVPESGFQKGVHYSPKYLRVFDAVAENITVDPDWIPFEKIYMSRSKLSRAAQYEFGFETADHYFEKNGYTILYPETLSLSQMIFFIRNAKTIAAVSGSLPHNLFFGKQGQKLEILERCVLINDWQVYMNQMKELDVTYIDGHLSLYTVSMVGPFMMGYTECMKRFSDDRGYCPPDDKYLCKKHYRSCFVQYMKSYQDTYGYHWFIEDYLHSEISYHAEAYEDSRTYFEEFLNRSRPYLWHHYFQFHYWKQAIKRLLGK